MSEMSEMSKIITIGVCGQVSSGKSSFVNSLIGYPTACVALQRETFSPTMYELRKNAPIITLKTINEIHARNKVLRTKKDTKPSGVIDTYKTKCIHDYEFNILDFPGVNDGLEESGKFTQILIDTLEKVDLLFYITDVKDAFMKKHECDLFDSLRKSIKDTLDNGHLIHLKVILNKYDNIEVESDDENEMEELCDAVKLKYNTNKSDIFRYSSHKNLIYNLFKSGARWEIPAAFKTAFVQICKNSDILHRDVISTDSKKVQFIAITANNMPKNITDRYGDWDNVWKHITFNPLDLQLIRTEFTMNYIEKNITFDIKAKTELQIIDTLKICLDKFKKIFTKYGCDSTFNQKAQLAIIGQLIKIRELTAFDLIKRIFPNNWCVTYLYENGKNQNLAVYQNPNLFDFTKKMRMLADLEIWKKGILYQLIEPVSNEQIITKIINSDDDIKYIYDNFANAPLIEIKKNFIISLIDIARIKKISLEYWYYLVYITESANFTRLAIDGKLQHHAFAYEGFWDYAQKKQIALIK